MGYKDIVDGDKTAKAIGARFIKTEKGTPGIEVAFEFLENSTGNPERLNWVGWLTTAAIERTMDVLANVLGCNGSEIVDANGNYTDPKFLDYKREVKIVVEGEEYEGKIYPKIKWVNAIGGSAFAGCSPEIVKNELGAIGFKAAFLAAKQATAQTGPQPGPAVVNHAPGAAKKPLQF